MVLTGLALRNFALAGWCAATVFLSLCYSVWLFNRLFYGGVAPGVKTHEDLTPVEFSVLGWTVVATLVLGWGGGSFVGWTHHCYSGVFQSFPPG